MSTSCDLATRLSERERERRRKRASMRESESASVLFCVWRGVEPVREASQAKTSLSASSRASGPCKHRRSVGFEARALRPRLRVIFVVALIMLNLFFTAILTVVFCQSPYLLGQIVKISQIKE